MGITGLDRERVARVAPVVASLALHVALIGAAAVVVPRASARILDAISVELVAVEPPRVIETPPAPPAPAKRLTPPKPIATPLPKIEPKREPPAREPDPIPPPAAPAPTASPAPPAAAAPRTSSVPLGPGVSWIDTTTTAPPANSASPSVASIPHDAGVTSVARPTGGYQIRPSYPSSARRLGVQGTTMLRVHVLDDGRVGDVDVEQSAGHHDLDQAAADAVRRWRFEPARRGDEAVAMWVRVPVEFRLK